MGKNKLARFRENETFALLHQPAFADLFRGDFELKGRWHRDFFGNENPIVLELGCGRGEYTVEMARLFPDKNFIGIDVKGARLWRGAKAATEEGRRNVAFVRTRIEVITSLFAPGEVSEIWITFPDPQPSRARKRLCSPMFLNRYAKILAPQGVVHLKTDSRMLHEYAKAVLAASGVAPLQSAADLYAEGVDAVLSIKTAYEEIFISEGYPITYLKFLLPQGKALVEPEGFTYSGGVPKARTRQSRQVAILRTGRFCA
ncbi:MAG: tRNA (guanosine(46)-N7)-methyltransferase TrmB [Prevotellaceae bacterium]|jgi:tRNA (guanine-N7-)-methyltransferase|nr:tRNA (guanosine(46)-N7)-methyltransferase TrmB [Prevotellaceae bacterium]